MSLTYRFADDHRHNCICLIHESKEDRRFCLEPRTLPVLTTSRNSCIPTLGNHNYALNAILIDNNANIVSYRFVVGNYGCESIHRHSFLHHRRRRLLCRRTRRRPVRKEVRHSPFSLANKVSHPPVSSRLFAERHVTATSSSKSLLNQTLVSQRLNGQDNYEVHILISAPEMLAYCRGEREIARRSECISLCAMYRDGEGRIFNSTISIWKSL